MTESKTRFQLAVRRAARILMITAAIGLIPMALTVLLPLMARGHMTGPEVAYLGVISWALGGVIYAVAKLTLHLQEKLGRATAYAAITGGLVATSMAVSQFVKPCPASLSGDRCTIPESADIGLAVGLLYATIVIAWSALRVSGRWFVRLRRALAGEEDVEVPKFLRRWLK